MSSQLALGPVFANAAIAPIAVLVVDDQPAVREGLARLLASGTAVMLAISTAANCAEALREAARVQPDLVVIDVDLAGEDGLALIALLPSKTSVLVLTSHCDAATRARALRLGALAVIGKHESADLLVRAVARIAHLHSRGEKSPIPPGASTHAPMDASSVAAWPSLPESQGHGHR